MTSATATPPQMSFDLQRENMVHCQLRTTGVTDPAVVRALRTVQREQFVPDHLKPVAYVDEDLEIVPGRFLMEPMVLGKLLVALDVRPGERVLVIGAGSGYSAAVFAELGADVTALEEHQALLAMARQSLPGSIKLVDGPLVGGVPEGAPYDIIFFDGAIELVPDSLLVQAGEGRISAVMNSGGVGRGMVARVVGGALSVNAFMDASVALLPGFAKPRTFTF